MGAILPVPLATDYVVAPSGGDFSSIQAALDAAVAGDRVLVEEKPGGYVEKLVFPRSGNAVDGPIELRAAPGHAPILDGTGVPGPWMITVIDRSYITVAGLEIRNNLGVVNDGSGIRIQGAGSHIELRDNVIHDMRGFGAMGITVYGTSTTTSISDLVIDGNLIYDCEPADSEALTLNGNVEAFTVSNNVVRDVNNIGIDFIGGETSINPTQVARNGVCRGNVVLRANSNYGGGYGAGIYVDGGRDIVIEGNVVSGSDLGIEVGAENAGIETSGVLVRGNLIVGNEKVGIVFGGYDQATGRVVDCAFVHNVCFKNDTLEDGNGELWVQFANDNVVANNVFYCGSQELLLANYNGTGGNLFDSNLWFCDSAAQPEYVWNSTSYSGLAAFRTGTGFGVHSVFSDPRFVDPLGPDLVVGTGDDDFRLAADSPCIDAGDADRTAGATGDHHGLPRAFDDPDVADTGLGTGPLPDLGAHERQALTAQAAKASLSAGGVQLLELDAGDARAGALFVLRTSPTGHAASVALDVLATPAWMGPRGIRLAGLPGNAHGAMGFLDSQGRATASLTLEPGAPPALAGTVLQSRFTLFDPALGSRFESNAMPLRLAP